MAHFVEQYTHAIQTSEDYGMLTRQIEICISRNVLNYVSSDIKEAIDRLNVDTPFNGFIRMMVWASTVSDHTETSLNLLRYFCNKVASQFDSLSFELDDYSLMVIAICADDKSFIGKLSEGKMVALANALCWWNAVRTDSENSHHIADELFCISIRKILEGFTLDQLDRYFASKYNDLCADPEKRGIYIINEVVRPFQALFINVTQNIAQSELLFQISNEEWINKIDRVIKGHSEFYATKGSSSNPEDYMMMLNDIIFIFAEFSKNFSNNKYTGFNNPVAGRFIWAFLEWLHIAYGRENITLDEIKFLIRDAKKIFYEYYAVTERCKYVIDSVIDAYCNSPDHEDILTKGKYLDAIKMYWNGDSMFMTWYGIYKDNNRDAHRDAAITTFISSYMNPNFERVDKMLEAAEAAVAMEASEVRSDEEEDYNITPDEEEYEYDGPEIEATQSKKGYKKSSKKLSDGERKIYGAYKKYKNNEEKVDSQLAKMLSSAKKAFSQDKTEEIIEGKKFTPLGLLKKVLVTAAIFNYSKVAAFVYLLVSHTLNKKRTKKQKTEILLEIETEIKMLDEKIEDARGDGNRKAKYALMRTKAELVRARDKIRYNLTATKEDMKTAKSYINNDNRDDI